MKLFVTILEVIGIILAVIGALGFVALAYVGLTHCPKCHGWCVDESECSERQRREWNEEINP